MLNLKALIIQTLNNLITALIRMEGKSIPDNFFDKTVLLVQIKLSPVVENAKTGNRKLMKFASDIRRSIVGGANKPFQRGENNEDDNKAVIQMSENY